MTDINKQFEKLKEGGVELKKEVRERTVGYIIAALGFVAGLAWNEAIKALIDHFFPLSQNSLLAKFAYAIVVTIILVVLTVYLVRFFGRRENKK